MSGWAYGAEGLQCPSCRAAQQAAADLLSGTGRIAGLSDDAGDPLPVTPDDLVAGERISGADVANHPAGEQILGKPVRDMWSNMTRAEADERSEVCEHGYVAHTCTTCEPFNHAWTRHCSSGECKTCRDRTESMLAEARDELGERRERKHEDADLEAGAVRVLEGVGGIGDMLAAAKGTREFQQWMLDNLPSHEFSHHCHGLVGGIVGSVIGTWFDAGADDELVKEYLCRFVDMSWRNYQAVLRASTKEPTP